MIDVVRYRLPFGVLGRIVHALKVRGDVRRNLRLPVPTNHELFEEQKRVTT